MKKLAETNPKLIGITAAMLEGTGLDCFAKTYPDRFFDVGIAEQHAVTFAAGLATEGFKPVVAVYSTFLQRAYDQIVHDICLQNLPVVFAMDRCGISGRRRSDPPWAVRSIVSASNAKYGIDGPQGRKRASAYVEDRSRTRWSCCHAISQRTRCGRRTRS